MSKRLHQNDLDSSTREATSTGASASPAEVRHRYIGDLQATAQRRRHDFGLHRRDQQLLLSEPHACLSLPGLFRPVKARSNPSYSSFLRVLKTGPRSVHQVGDPSRPLPVGEEKIQSKMFGEPPHLEFVSELLGS